MAFSVLSWNVEAFRGDSNRLPRIVSHICRGETGHPMPDIFALFEVEDVNVTELMRNRFPGYDFHLTDGPQNKEILVGVRHSAFDQVNFTQKRQFKSYNPRLRPGALLAVRQGNVTTYLLFLHTDSGTKASDFGNRFEMFDNIRKLKIALDRDESSAARFLVLGDLNTMGLKYPRQRVGNEIVSEDEEIMAFESILNSVDLNALSKTEDLTFNNYRFESDLDHVLVSSNVGLKIQGQDSSGDDVSVLVDGWNQLTGNARRAFIEQISDHSALFVEVR